MLRMVIPIEARRAGLGTDDRCWVTLDEIDTDVPERSWLFEDRTPLGAFPRAFVDRMRQGLLAAVTLGRTGVVDTQG